MPDRIIEYRRLEDVLPADANPKGHNVPLIRESIELRGFAGALIEDQRTKKLIGGHGRLIALKQMRDEGQTPPDGIGKDDDDWLVPVEVGWSSRSDAEARAMLVAQNRTVELGGWNEVELGPFLFGLKDAGELSGTGFNDDDLRGFGSAGGAGGFGGEQEPPMAEVPAESHRAEELRKEWGVESGSLWGIGRHRILCGDATDRAAVERVLAGATPRLCVTDPPYGVNYDARWRDEAARRGTIDFAARRTEKVTGDEPGQAGWKEAWMLMPCEVLYQWAATLTACVSLVGIEAAGFVPRATIIWSKPHFVISRGHYGWQHEMCWYAVRKGATAGWIGKRIIGTVWNVALDANVEGGHGTQKPAELMRRAITNHEGDVYEPFAGTGTTILAAEHEDRTCYAVEIEPKFVAVTLQRWLASSGERAIRLD